MTYSDARVREIIDWHFDPATGCPSWLERASGLGWNPRREIKRSNDLRRFGGFEDEWLRGGPVQRWVQLGQINSSVVRPGRSWTRLCSWATSTGDRQPRRFPRGATEPVLALALDPGNQRGHTNRKLRRHVAVRVGPVLVRAHSSLQQGGRIRIRHAGMTINSSGLWRSDAIARCRSRLAASPTGDVINHEELWG